jgi:hypothetical protein
VKAHDNNSGNDLADQLAKEATCDEELDITYNKYPKSAVISELKKLGLQKWQSEWDSSNKEALTKFFFPKVKDRLAKRLQMSLNRSTLITGHEKLGAYLHRFKIIKCLMCPCEKNPQTTDHLIRECTLLSKQRQILKNSITKMGGRWPISNTELANKYTNLFQILTHQCYLVKNTKYGTHRHLTMVVHELTQPALKIIFPILITILNTIQESMAADVTKYGTTLCLISHPSVSSFCSGTSIPLNCNL